MSAAFCLQHFIDAPSIEIINSCRKNDLLQIVDHFQLQVSKNLRKCDLKPLVVDKLVEAGVIQAPVLPVVSGVPSQAAVVEESQNGSCGDGEGDERGKMPRTLPRYDPLSSGSSEGREGARLKVRLARLQLEAEEKAQNRRAQLELEIRRLEIEADKAVRLRKLELESQPQASSVSADNSGPTSSSASAFKIDKCISLVPTFRETEVDTYFAAFERIAGALQWPSDIWPLLLQCKLSGKAQEVVAALSLKDSLDYSCVKTAVLQAYELVPEAYRQRFRQQKKLPTQTYVEFAREKGILFDKWCVASKASDYDALRELVLLEDFKKCIPERIVLYLNEQKVTSLASAAVLADEFVLTHKASFTGSEKPRVSTVQPPHTAKVSGSRENRECFYCHKTGHVIADCLALKRKTSNAQQPKGVGFVKAEARNEVPGCGGKVPDPCFEPFIFDGSVSLTDNPSELKPVRILRDTGGSQTVILSSVLPFSTESECGFNSVLRGIEMGYAPRPVHRVIIKSKLVTGFFPVAVCPALPIEGVAMLLGNDIAGGLVLPRLEVLDNPLNQKTSDVSMHPGLYPACAITRAQARKDTDVDLSDSVLMSSFSEENDVPTNRNNVLSPPDSVKPEEPDPFPKVSSLPLTRDQLSAAQLADETLQSCFKRTVSAEQVKKEQQAYFVEHDVLMRQWSPPGAEGAEWSKVKQIVVPSVYRQKILALAHESQWSGHLGITKTYQLLLKHFFWPGMKRDVSKFCRSCHVCQIAGKPNQVIPPAPLCPIPVVDQPFDHVIVDCQYLLTIMCAATRFPEAVPLHKVTAKSVVKALTTFFSVFGLPKVIQTDQGSNFQSRLFKQVASTLGVKHIVSSAYHPESQGALERWHQTLKAMLRKYCLKSEKSWDEGVPFVLFAARDAVQESLGFSPSELVFGHRPRGPLKALKEAFLSPHGVSKVNVSRYVKHFRERLNQANALAKQHLAISQGKMKRHYDKASVKRTFQVGDQVLVLLPVPGSALSARYSGPFKVCEKRGETDYAICTPDRRHKTRVCHINMLKLYHPRSTPEPAGVCAPIVASSHLEKGGVDEVDGLKLSYPTCSRPRLSNSEMLKALPSLLEHLSLEQQEDITVLIDEYTCLFGDVPTRTTVLEHDIDVQGAKPIKQHPYRASPHKRLLMRQEADYLLQNGLAKPSQSPWSSPCIVESKPDGSPCFITDFRKVNSVTVADSHPLPRIEDCVDSIGTAQYVTKLDLLKGYWQVPLTERASNISAFVTPDDFLQYTVMAFGMCNAPATFQRLVNKVLRGLSNCSAYLDDLVIYTETWQDHLETLRQVFHRLAQATLTLNLAKCEFAKATVTYLGREVGRGQVRPIDAKVAVITEFPTPTTRRELRRFLGMVGYYRNFCKNFSSVVKPLTDLLSPKVEFIWSSECQDAFESAKALLCHTPVLAAPDLTRPFKLEVDASAVGAGAVLLQEDLQGLDHPVCYFSRKFNKNQLNYSTIEKETLALLLALQHFHVYLGSSMLPLVVYTDHNPLVFLARMFNHNQRLMRWALLLQEYNLSIHHKKGSENVLADGLSRL
ncbi:DnaJ-like proiein [Sarotherodon galilaeus]